MEDNAHNNSVFTRVRKFNRAEQHRIGFRHDSELSSDTAVPRRFGLVVPERVLMGLRHNGQIRCKAPATLSGHRKWLQPSGLGVTCVIHSEWYNRSSGVRGR